MEVSGAAKACPDSLWIGHDARSLDSSFSVLLFWFHLAPDKAVEAGALVSPPPTLVLTRHPRLGK